MDVDRYRDCKRHRTWHARICAWRARQALMRNMMRGLTVTIALSFGLIVMAGASEDTDSATGQETHAVAGELGSAAAQSAGKSKVSSLSCTATTTSTHAAAKTAAQAQSAPKGCVRQLTWPLRGRIAVLREFDGPAQPWLSGHRGVDLLAERGDVIVAPASGTITFAGKVGGKSVVSLRHGSTVSSFEPAVTTLFAGDGVLQGRAIAVVDVGSDHCDGRCLHWGVRRGRNQYVDPAALTVARRIGLKSR